MALVDTYNGDLTRFRVYCPQEGSNFTTQATEFQELAYAFCNIEIAKYGVTPPLTGADIENALKMAEAMIAGGYFAESNIDPADDKEFGKKSQLRKSGEELLKEWLENKYGQEGENAADFISHVKVSRPASIAASEYKDARDVI